MEVENKKKQWFPLCSLIYFESLVSVKGNTDREKKEKEKNMDRTLIKVNGSQAKYNVNILPQ